MSIDAQSTTYNQLLYPTNEAWEKVRRLGAIGLEWFDASLRMTSDMATTLSLPIAPAFAVGETYVHASSQMAERLARPYGKPEFGLNETTIGGASVAVVEELVEVAAFGSLRHFARKDAVSRETLERTDPPLLVVAPMSGHYATLLRDTVRQLLPAHDVYITDWESARDVPSAAGEFGIDKYIDYVQSYIRTIGGDVHILAVCQATVPVLAAAANMAETDPTNQPASVTLMAGPLDTRAAPSVVTQYAESHALDWYRKNVVAKVPQHYEGAGKLVYPGFMQLAAFVLMNEEKHKQSHRELFEQYVHGTTETAARIEEFYNEYQSVADLSARFYLETLERVFLDQQLAKGTFDYRGQRVNLEAITNVPVFTVEGEKDDICPPGQTEAVHQLLTGLSDEQKYHYVQPDIGHYGVFSGKRWQHGIVPQLTDFARTTSQARGMEYSALPAETTRHTPQRWSSRRTTV